MKIVELKASPTSLPLPPSVIVEIDEELLVKHPVVEGPSYV